MVITDQFVYIHMPKTGGTFVTEMLQQIYDYAPPQKYGHGLIEKVTHRMLGRTKMILTDKHGYCSAIPKEYEKLPIVGCVRNPYDRYVSQYEFKWWLNYPEHCPGVEEHPSFPNLSFSEYVHLADERWASRDNPFLRADPSLGWHTNQFINWYCRDVESILEAEGGKEATAERVRANLYPQTFLRTDSLNKDLYGYLKTLGFQDSQLECILRTGKIFPVEGGRSIDQRWEKYYTPELKEFVRQRERILFELFPEFDG